MAWSKSLPASDQKLRTLAGVITDNWQEIEENETAVKAQALNQWAIHLIDRNDASVSGAAIPTSIDDVGMLYCNNASGSNQLYYQDGESTPNKIQLTRSTEVTEAENGQTFLPGLAGGLLLQWFKVTSVASGIQAITFPTAFPTAIYNVQVTILASDTEDASGDLYIADTTAPTVTGFNVRNRTKTVDLYVMAIGK